MTNSNNSHFTCMASILNLGYEKKSGKRFPEDGEFDVDEWADIWGVSSKRIREWIAEYDIPYWGPSQKCIMIEAVEFKKAVLKGKKPDGKKTKTV